MSYIDSVCFHKDYLILDIPRFDIDSPADRYCVNSNISVGFYYFLMVTTKELESCTDQEKRLELLQAVAFELLKLDKSKDLSFLDVVDRYDNPALLQDLYFTAVYLCNKVSESNDLFFVPEIELDSDKDSKPSTVEKILSKSGDIELMESIVFVSMQTHNSYQEVLDMPFVVFQSYLKHIKVHIAVPNGR